MFSRQEFEIVVAELNNQGVISIGANDINGAITTFERGLRCLSLMLLEQTPFETLKVGERADTCNVRPIPGLVGSGGFGSVSTASEFLARRSFQMRLVMRSRTLPRHHPKFV